MPERFLLQILRELVNGGILRSVRGVEGGYCLAKPPEEVSLREVLEAVDGPLVASVPPLEQSPVSAQDKLLEPFERVAAMMRDELSKVTLADLVGVPDQPSLARPESA